MYRFACFIALINLIITYQHKIFKPHLLFPDERNGKHSNTAKLIAQKQRLASVFITCNLNHSCPNFVKAKFKMPFTYSRKRGFLYSVLTIFFIF